MAQPVFLGVRFSPESPLYTYVADREWVQDLSIGDFVIVPVRDGTLKVAKFMKVMKSPPQNVACKWIVQRVDPTLIERANQAPYQIH